MVEDLTHFDADGAARMVSVGDKPETPRRARARATVRMQLATLDAIEAHRVGKGDALAVARIAAIAGVKQTSGLIPLCHPIRVTGVEVVFESRRDDAGAVVSAEVEVHAVDRTGPEMEALSGAATAALALIDMAKAIDRTMSIESVLLLAKSGGKTGDWTRPSLP